jgi:diguanylate cyclase (GGDEF)-like protein/PAS domain S-box-containing protein
MAILREEVAVKLPFNRTHIRRLSEMALTISIALHAAALTILPGEAGLAQWWTVALFGLAALIPLERDGGKRQFLRRLATLGVITAASLTAVRESGIWVWLPSMVHLAADSIPSRIRNRLTPLLAIGVWLLIIGIRGLDPSSALFWLLVELGLVVFILYVQRWFDSIDNLIARYELLQAALDFAPDLIAVKDPHGRYLLVNRTMREALQREGRTTEAVGKHTHEIFPSDTATSIITTDQQVLQEKRVVTSTERWVDRSGTVRWDSTTKAPLLDEAGNVVAIIGTSRDVTDIKRAEEITARERNLLRLIVDTTPLTIVALDVDGNQMLANTEAQRVFQEELPKGEEGFTNAQFFISPEIYRRWLKHQHRVLAQGGLAAPNPTLVEVVSFVTQRGETQWRQVTFVPIFTEAGDYTGVLNISENITQRAVMQGALEYQATHDSMTGLPNRRLLLGQIGDAMAQQPRPALAILFCDLDQFKWVNDSLGHDTGDRLLKAVAMRFEAPLEQAHTLVRIGGDEFVVLMEQDGTAEGAMALARTLLRTLTEPVELDGMRFALSVSIGVACLRPDHDRAEALIRDADIAMYRAKELGGNEVALFDETLRARVQRRLALSQSLREALRNEALEVYYQPKVSFLDGTMTGFEALARWYDADEGWITPDEFVPVAEETGQIGKLGEWILRAACHQLRAWDRAEPERMGQMTLCVNVSVRQLQEAGFADLVAQVIAETGIDPARLYLEITESALISYADHTISQFGALKRLGVMLAVDDFGTGYSSLSYLRRFPVDVLKLDRSLIMDIDTNSESRVIVQKVIELAIALNIEVIAEGVERPDQVRVLRELGCDSAQGFIYSRPLPPEQASQWKAVIN